MGERDPNGECYVCGFESSDLNNADRYRDCCVEEQSNVSHRYPSEHIQSDLRDTVCSSVL